MHSNPNKLRKYSQSNTVISNFEFVEKSKYTGCPNLNWSISQRSSNKTIGILALIDGFYMAKGSPF